MSDSTILQERVSQATPYPPLPCDLPGTESAAGDRSPPWDGNTAAENPTTSDGDILPSNSKTARTLSTRAMASHNAQQNGDVAKGGLDSSEKAGKSRSQVLVKLSTAHSSAPPKNRSPTEFLKRPQTPPVITNGTDPRRPAESVRGGLEDAAKDKKKGVSFLSRFIAVGTKKPKSDNLINSSGAGDRAVTLGLNHDGLSDASDLRPEGMDAQLFAHAVDVDNIEYNPRHPQPPSYIRVHAKYKRAKEFDRLFLAQQLRTSRTRKSPGSDSSESNGISDPNAIWALKFSKDGRYLAAGGQDKVIRVWAVLSTPEERREFEKSEDEQKSRTRLNAPVFLDEPVRIYRGHQGPVIDLDWSKNNFLLSSSYDKTVRLWHVSRPECLCTFKHSEHVFSARFHPRDDRFFLAGSRDMKLRLWSIPDKSVALSNQLPDVITAVAFTPDGNTAIAGTCNGLCCFFETEGLKYQSQIQVRSAHGRNAKGSKICSIEAINAEPGTSLWEKGSGSPQVKVLISSADSRVRLYNLRDKSLDAKFKGHKAEELPIHATMSDCGMYIVAGSEDRAAYIWSTSPPENDSKPGQRPVEHFDASREKTTAVVLSPTKARELLSRSQDPIYDLCNPPPVTLLSRAESFTSSRPPTEANSVQNTPMLDSPSKRTATTHYFPAMGSPAYLAKCAHLDGQIIVTASSGGAIRVYRQDCAYAKRRASDLRESSSVFTARKRPSSIYMGRAFGSSNSTRNRRSDSNSTQPPQDRILSWRQGIGSSTSLDRGALRQSSDVGLGIGKSRSISPRKSVGSLISGRSTSRQRDTEHPPTPPIPTMSDLSLTESPPQARHPARASLSSFRTASQHSTPTLASVSEPPRTRHRTGSGSTNTTSASASNPNNPLMLSGGKSYMFWDPRQWVGGGSSQSDPALLSAERPGLNTKLSVASGVSMLSSEVEIEEEEADEPRCRSCGDTRLSTKMSVRGVKTTVCEGCGGLAPG